MHEPINSGGRDSLRDEPSAVLRQDALKDDLAEDDADGGGEVAEEIERTGGNTDVFGRNERLHADDECLHVGADAGGEQDLEDDDAWPVASRAERDHEAKREREDGHADPNDPEVVARSLDHDAHDNSGCGKGDGEGEHPDTGADGAGRKNLLKIEREEKDGCDEAYAVAEDDAEGRDQRHASEYTPGNHWVPRKAFVESKDAVGYQAEDDQADHDCRVPWMTDTAKVDAKEEHDSGTHDKKRSDPVDSAESMDEWSFGVVNF